MWAHHLNFHTRGQTIGYTINKFSFSFSTIIAYSIQYNTNFIPLSYIEHVKHEAYYVQKRKYLCSVNVLSNASNLTNRFSDIVPGLQIYGGPRSLSHDFKIWPITFEGSGPSGPILFSCVKISL